MDRDQQLDYLKKLAQLMKDSDLSEITLKDDNSSIRLRRGQQAQAPVLTGFTGAPAEARAAATGGADAAAPAADGTVTINSPIVGTFYMSPSPDADSFVEVGANVEEDTTVCIVEAMKVMNEIKAELRGEIVEVLVRDAEPVEFGTPLFRVKPY